MAVLPDSTATTAAAASQLAAVMGTTASGTAATGVMPSCCAKTCQHSLPHAIPVGTPITSHPGQRDCLPHQRAADLPRGEAERPQDREDALPPPHRGDQQVRDGQQRDRREPDAEYLRKSCTWPKLSRSVGAAGPCTVTEPSRASRAASA